MLLLGGFPFVLPPVFFVFAFLVLSIGGHSDAVIVAMERVCASAYRGDSGHSCLATNCVLYESVYYRRRNRGAGVDTFGITFGVELAGKPLH